MGVGREIFNSDYFKRTKLSDNESLAEMYDSILIWDDFFRKQSVGMYATSKKVLWVYCFIVIQPNMLGQDIKSLTQNEMYVTFDVKHFVIIVFVFVFFKKEKYLKKNQYQWAFWMCNSDNNGHLMEVRIRARLLLFNSQKYIYYV